MIANCTGHSFRPACQNHKESGQNFSDQPNATACIPLVVLIHLEKNKAYCLRTENIGSITVTPSHRNLRPGTAWRNISISFGLAAIEKATTSIWRIRYIEVSDDWSLFIYEARSRKVGTSGQSDGRITYLGTNPMHEWFLNALILQRDQP